MVIAHDRVIFYLFNSENRKKRKAQNVSNYPQHQKAEEKRFFSFFFCLIWFNYADIRFRCQRFSFFSLLLWDK